MITLYTEAYGEGEFLGYDPRFPGTFSAKFNIKGKDVVINNLKKRDLTRITEILEVDCLYDDEQSMTCIDQNGSTHKTICANVKGEKVKIEHMKIFATKPNIEFWSIYYKYGTIDDKNNFINTYRYPPAKYDLTNFMNFEFGY